MRRPSPTKEEFSYSLASTNGTITTNTFTIELHPTITGTSGNDTLTSSAYDDTITSGAGTDTLVYHLLSSADATGGKWSRYLDRFLCGETETRLTSATC